MQNNIYIFNQKLDTLMWGWIFITPTKERVTGGKDSENISYYYRTHVLQF